MDPLVRAVALLNEFLNEQGIRFMLIGGLANAVWGRIRATTDVDLVLVLDDRSITEIAHMVGTRFKFLKPNPVEFAKRTYVMPIQVTDSVTADLSLAILPYEQQALERAVMVDIGGVRVPMCRPEDLVIYKAISEREKDWFDIEGVLNRQGKALDQDYIIEWLNQFADALQRPELVQRYRALRRKIKRRKKKSR